MPCLAQPQSSKVSLWPQPTCGRTHINTLVHTLRLYATSSWLIPFSCNIKLQSDIRNDGGVSTRILPPHLNITALAESAWCSYFGALGSIEGFKFPGLDGRLWLIWSTSALGMVLARHRLSSQTCLAGSHECIPGTVCTQLAHTHLLNIKDLCSHHSLLLLISVE